MLTGAPQHLWPSDESAHRCVLDVQVLHCSAILAPNQDAAFMLSILWTAIQLLMSNFFITFTEVVFRWMTVLRWVSALYYAFEGLAVTEFGGMTYRYASASALQLRPPDPAEHNRAAFWRVVSAMPGS